MEDASSESGAIRCSSCSAAVEAGRIFCRKCGAAIAPATPLTIHTDDANGLALPTGWRRVLSFLFKAVACISLVVFWACPLSSGTQFLTFVGSIALLLLCHVGLTEIDESYRAKAATGYWPRPLDWKSLFRSGVDR
jgi:hypothetical protein